MADPRPSPRRQRVVIVGGGTAGWMTAASLAQLLPRRCDVRLIESEEIGIVGVGEATLPHLRHFNDRLGLDEAAFMRATSATYKLGIDFRDWARKGDSYIHPFGTFGREVDEIAFHHYWLRARAGGRTEPIDDYSLPVVAARMARFKPSPPEPEPAPVQGYGWAYHFDSTRFAPFLRGYAEARGVRRTEGRVVDVTLDGESGDIRAVTLATGERIEGDLFVDCSGFRSLLLGGALGEAWEDWSRWLPCDRAVALPCDLAGPLLPYTQAIAMEAGWRWRIPLQHRTGNGYVYSSAHIGDDEAAVALLASLDGAPRAEPRVLRFKAGRRRRSCVANCVAVGLASGFLEPLESTSLYLAQLAIQTLIELFPDDRFTPLDRAEFNRVIDFEYDRVRDFLILHYNATERDDTPFWNDMRTMAVPDSLARKRALFERRGRVESYTTGLFLEVSWVAVYLGQRVVPQSWDQRVDRVPAAQLAAALDRLRDEIQGAAKAMPLHEQAIAGRGAAVAA